MENNITQHHPKKDEIMKILKRKEPEPSLEHPHPIHHPPQNPLCISIKEEVMDSGYGDEEEGEEEEEEEEEGRVGGVLLDGHQRCDVGSDRESSARYDPEVVVGLKVELDVAEDPAVEGRDHGEGHGGESRSGADDLCINNSPALDAGAKKPGTMDSPTASFRTDRYRSTLLTGLTSALGYAVGQAPASRCGVVYMEPSKHCDASLGQTRNKQETRDGHIIPGIPTLTGQPHADVWTTDSLQYEPASVSLQYEPASVSLQYEPASVSLQYEPASVSQLVLQGLGSNQEPWCVIKTEALSESDSADTDAADSERYAPENGARAVFNRDKGGRANLEVFLGVRNGEKRYFCPEAGCGKSYKRGEHLKIHALSHTGDRPYLCPEPSCSKSFAHPFVLKEHVKIHTGEKPFQCTESNCGRCFRDRSNYRKHQLMHSGQKPARRRKPVKKPEKKLYPCSEPNCEKTFSRPSVLREHMKRHIGDKRFQCSEPGCEKGFVKKADLIMHERIHTGERPYCCVEPGCGKSFARSGHLKDHKITHSGEKPFPCSTPGCGRSFTQNIQLSYHMRTHTGEKPYRCPEAGCDKAYTQNKHLRYHLRSHSGSQPFPCPHHGCERSFDRPSLLAKHCRSQHGKTVDVDADRVS